MIGYKTMMSVQQSVRIGNDCMIAEGCMIFDNDGHPLSPYRGLRKEAIRHDEVRPVVIEDNAWIGARSIILKGVRFGEGAVAGARSPVVRDVPAYSFVRGSPAEMSLTGLDENYRADIDRSPMKFEIIDPTADLDAVRKIWTNLNRGHSYFLSWGWIENWIAHLPDGVRLHFAFRKKNETPVMAFFFGEKKTGLKMIIRSRCYYLNATGHVLPDSLCLEYNAFACAKPLEYDLKEVLDHIPGKWEEIYLPALNVNLFPGNRLKAELISPYQLHIEREESSPFVDLEKIRSKGDYFSLLSANTRAQVRRTYRFAVSRGQITTTVAADVDSALEIYDQMVALHQKTWINRGEPGAFSSKFFYNFHRDLVKKRFVAGEIQLIRVSLGGVVLGCLYNFVMDGHVFYYQGGVNYETDPQIKPGIICHVEAIHYNAARGRQVYDFLGGSSRYKSSLSTDKNRMIWAKIRKKRFKFSLEERLRLIKQQVEPTLTVLKWGGQKPVL